MGGHLAAKNWTNSHNFQTFAQEFWQGDRSLMVLFEIGSLAGLTSTIPWSRPTKVNGTDTPINFFSLFSTKVPIVALILHLRAVAGQEN